MHVCTVPFEAELPQYASLLHINFVGASLRWIVTTDINWVGLTAYRPKPRGC